VGACCCYVGERDTGKTTALKKVFLALRQKSSAFIFVVDSAVEEGDKSLIRQLQSAGYAGSCFTFKCPEDLLIFKSRAFESSPVFCDVSYYLERGHEARDPTRKQELREHYKDLVADILEIILSADWQEAKLVIVMDEIEINDRAGRIILDHLSEISIAIAAHNTSYVPKELLGKTRTVVLTERH